MPNLFLRSGYTGGDVYPYIRHHNPLSYFSDVVNSSVEGECGSFYPVFSY